MPMVIPSEWVWNLTKIIIKVKLNNIFNVNIKKWFGKDKMYLNERGKLSIDIIVTKFKICNFLRISGKILGKKNQIVLVWL